MRYIVYSLTVILLFNFPAFAWKEVQDKNNSFAVFIESVKHDAKIQGISEETLDKAFADIGPDPRILVLDGKQPESQITLDEYLEKTVTKARITKGRELFAEHRKILDDISKKYSVPAPVILALWGIETSYGKNTGGVDVVEALATLAYDGRRSEYFRTELVNALWILEVDHIAQDEFQGSWAGAMGQCQFMPTSFLKYAVDYDGDGKRDIWNTQADVFASMANYLHSEGWNPEIKIKEGDNNFKVLLKWNRSRYFANAVATLADAIGE